jgi:hypothetical protein
MRWKGINLYSIIWIIKITMEWNRMELTSSHTTNLSSILFHSIWEVREGMWIFCLFHHILSKQWNGIFIPFHSVSFHFILPLHSIPLYFISPNRASLGISKMLCSSYNPRIMKNEFLEKARFEFYNLNYKITFWVQVWIDLTGVMSTLIGPFVAYCEKKKLENMVLTSSLFEVSYWWT